MQGPVGPWLVYASSHSLLFFVLLIGLCISTAFPTCPLPDVTIRIQILILIIDMLVGGTLHSHICIN